MINEFQNIKIDGAPEITQYEISLATCCIKFIHSIKENFAKHFDFCLIGFQAI